MLLSFKHKLILLAVVASFFAGFFANLTKAQEVPKPEEVKTEQTEKDELKAKRDERDTKTITERILKTKDDYIIQIRTKFLNNADKLASISTKIESRIVKIEIAGNDVSELNLQLEQANKSIKDARAELRSLPSKQSLINYADAKKYAGSIVSARNDLENAKETLTNIITNLKDLVIEKENAKE